MAEHHRVSVDGVRVRGTRDGLILRLPAHLPLPDLLGQVRGHIDGGGDFFRNAQVILDYEERAPNVEEIVALQALLAERGIRLQTVTASVPAHRDLLRSWGFHPLRVISSDERQTGNDNPVTGAEGDRTARYIQRTVRSGGSVHSDGDVVIVGDVNAGAEVYAAGDVIVWGTIRGTVHAGTSGDFGAVILALRFAPTQLRIASIFARSPDSQERGGPGPMIARVHNGEIIVEPWRAERRSV
mgnify:FL=1